MAPQQTSVPREVRDASVTDLVSGIVSDTGDLLGAHVESIRNELSEGLSDLRDRMRAVAFAAAAAIAATIALILAIAATLIEVGMAPFIAYWICAAITIVGLVIMVRRAGADKKGRSAGHPVEALARAGKDAAWVADRATDAVS